MHPVSEGTDLDHRHGRHGPHASTTAAGIGIHTMKSLLVLLLSLVLLWPGMVSAQAPATATTREIEQLFSALEQSNCQFYRNGSWYTAQKASAHLRRKYDYLLRRGGITSTESFIDLAASKSSMSGKPYLVKCGNGAPTESKDWFSKKLLDARASQATGISSKPKPLSNSH